MQWFERLAALFHTINCKIEIRFIRYFFCECPWAQLGGGHGDASPHFFRQWGCNMPCCPIFFCLGFVIYWFRTKLSPSHFTTKLRWCECLYYTFNALGKPNSASLHFTISTPMLSVGVVLPMYWLMKPI